MMIDVVGKTDYSAPWRLESSTENLKHGEMNNSKYMYMTKMYNFV